MSENRATSYPANAHAQADGMRQRRPVGGYERVPTTEAYGNGNGKGGSGGGAMSDEQLARQLQAQYDQEMHHTPLRYPPPPPYPVLAQPAPHVDTPFSCGQCGTTHIVREVVQNATFTCTRCGCQNRIVMGDQRRVVVGGRSRAWIPIPVLCNVM